MILDKMENFRLYNNLNVRIARGLHYLLNTDFANTASGRHDIDGDNLYAVISSYQTKDPDSCKLEAHRRYIDIQYIVSGCENIGVTTLNNQQPSIQYNEEKDVLFFKEDVSFISLHEGMFAVFFPDDLHMPGVKCNEAGNVTKVVVKVKI